MVCKKNDNEDLTMLCDGCNVACHIYCLDPKLDAVPQDAWYCAKCTEDRDDAFLTDSEFDLSR
jgi:bromodomain adjacent to zinc finger domain protein 1A